MKQEVHGEAVPEAQPSSSGQQHNEQPHSVLVCTRQKKINVNLLKEEDDQAGSDTDNYSLVIHYKI